MIPFNPIPPINFPAFIGDLNSSTVPFETRFVRNLIDGDITLPATYVRDLDEGIFSLNGQALTITGLQFGDAIRFAAESGFTFAFGPSGVTLNGQAFATATANNTTATFTFVTNVTAAQLEQMLEALTFQAGPTNPAQTSRTLSFTVNTPTQLTGSVALTLAAPQEQNQIQDLDNQTVLLSANSVRLDGAITLSDDFIAAYSSPGLLNNSTINITGWTGQTAPIRFASDTGITVDPQFPNLQWISIDGVLVASYNPFSGSIGLVPTATAATIERLIEAISIDPQLSTQTPTRTITVTVVTPTLPQHGTVTFTGATVLLNDLRETADVSLLEASTQGLFLDTSVTLSGNGPWGNGVGRIEVIGIADGDVISFSPAPTSELSINEETGAIQAYRGDPLSGVFLVDIAYFTAPPEMGYAIALADGITTAEVEKIIESLQLIANTSGERALEIRVIDGTGSVAKDTITVRVASIPTLTDMVEKLDLTAAEAAEGQLLDAAVTFKGDASLSGGGVVISGLLDGDVVELRTGDGSPISLTPNPNLPEYSDIIIGGRNVGTFYDDTPGGPQIVASAEATAADIEAILENLVFRTTGTGATRDITILINDANGDFATQVITVNILAPGAKEMSYAILQNVNGTLVPVENGTGTTGDLNPADLFADGTAPDDFVVQYSGLLNVGRPAFGESSVVSFRDVAPGTVLIVNGVSYPLEGPEGRLVLNLATGLHKITLQVPYESNMGQVVTTAPTLTFGTAVAPAPGNLWPPFDQTPLFDNVRTVPETLFRVEVTSTITIDVNQIVRTSFFYVTSLDDIPAQLAALSAQIRPPIASAVEQTYTTTTEVLGGTGADTLPGTGGNELLNGGAGNDTLLGSLGADTLDGGTGVNTLSYEGSNGPVTVNLAQGIGQGGHAEGDVIRNIQTVIGSDFADRLIGSAGNDTLYGGGGRDRVIGSAGDDLLAGGHGNDTLFGGDGNDRLFGGTGNDSLSGSDGDDTLIGNAGADVIDGGAGINLVSYASSGAGVTVDLVTGANSGGHAEGDQLTNIQQVTGSAFGDVLIGSATGADGLFGGEGDDSLQGNGGNDRLFGGAGDDTLLGGDGADRLIGRAGNDSLSGGTGADLLEGGAGADTLDGGLGTDTVSYASSAAGVTIDLAKGFASGGDAEGDVISNVERIIGSGHSDVLVGSAAAERLDGAAGSDTLDGGAGDDVLIGGSGADTFVFRTGFGKDRINDLGTDDQISLQPDLWGSVTVGDVAGLLTAYGEDLDGYVELRLTDADILRIDGITVQELLDKPDYFLLVS